MLIVSCGSYQNYKFIECERNMDGYIDIFEVESLIWRAPAAADIYTVDINLILVLVQEMFVGHEILQKFLNIIVIMHLRTNYF